MLQKHSVYASFCGLFAVAALAAQDMGSQPPNFYNDVAPLLEKHCKRCHTAGEIGPMPLTSYEEVRPWAAAIREQVVLRKMPPWFADPAHGKFSNDPRMSLAEIELIAAWAKSGAAAGTRPKPARTLARAPSPGISADMVLSAPQPFAIPAKAVVDYQYFVLPLPFTFDRWVRQVEIRPSDRSVVHHAVLYARDPKSTWLREAPVGKAYAPSAADPVAMRRSRVTTEDILAIYAPGAPPLLLPEGMAKKIPAGADLVLQVHYTSKDVATEDRPEIRLAFRADAPLKRVLTLQMGRDDLRIPPGERDYSLSVTGTLPGDAVLLSLYPHMHLRGSAFEFDIVGPRGFVDPLLSVKPYDFNWQLNYVLKSPRVLRKGTMLRWTGHFDNSSNNPLNPDPSAEVTWGEQSWEEMMIGFFDVAVDPGVSKVDFFLR